LTDLIAAIEHALGKTAERQQRPMQAGDVPLTFAGAELLGALTGYRPATPLDVGAARFCEWLRAYANKHPSPLAGEGVAEGDG
ncbi:MAG TPA: hypothetical protein VFE13_07630, partial [Caulobacteraceae bacterium]|nr:hypothetical protein [Caulobacteraceae bacterium]